MAQLRIFLSLDISSSSDFHRVNFEFKFLHIRLKLKIFDISRNSLANLLICIAENIDHIGTLLFHQILARFKLVRS